MKRIKGIIRKLTTSRPVPICILVVLLAFQYYGYYTNPHNAFPERYYGRPVVSTDYPEIDISIDQVLHDEKYLYILYHHSNGIVQVCDLDGIYQYSIFFYCHMNGGFSLAIDGSTLYVEDMRGNVYVFQNGEFDRFLVASEAKSELGSINFNPRVSSEDYIIRSNSVWKNTDGKEVCIVGEPKTNSDFSIQLLVIVCLILIVALLRFRSPHH